MKVLDHDIPRDSISNKCHHSSYYLSFELVILQRAFWTDINGIDRNVE